MRRRMAVTWFLALFWVWASACQALEFRGVDIAKVSEAALFVTEHVAILHPPIEYRCSAMILNSPETLRRLRNGSVHVNRRIEDFDSLFTCEEVVKRVHMYELPLSVGWQLTDRLLRKAGVIDLDANDLCGSRAHICKFHKAPQMFASKNFFGSQRPIFCVPTPIGTNSGEGEKFWNNPCTLSVNLSIGVFFRGCRRPFLKREAITHCLRGTSSFDSLPADDSKSDEPYTNKPPFGPFEGCVPLWRVGIGCAYMFGGVVVMYRRNRRLVFGCGCGLPSIGSFLWLSGHYDCAEDKHGCSQQLFRVD